ncbi:MAG: hypothetical protein WBA44_11640 [Mesorhizobium sp.]
MSDAPVTDATIADFRAANSEALMNGSHPLHGQRLGELSTMYERRFAAPAEIQAPDTTAAEHRVKHEAALLDSAHPDHRVRVEELSRITERDVVNGNQPGDDLVAFTEPAASPEAYDFTKAKGMVPFDSDLVPDPAFEAELRQTLHSHKVSPMEGDVIANRFMEAQRIGFVPTTAEQAAEGIRNQFRDKADEVIHAVRRLVTEAPPHMLTMIEDAGLANDTFIFNALAAAAKRKGYWK